MAKSKFVYRGGERTAESVTRKSQQGSGLYDSFLPSGIPMYKPKEGECCVRILPPTWMNDDKLVEKWGDGWDITVVLHYSIGPDNMAYLCLDKMKGETCPVCEARREATDDDERDQLRPSSRSLCWVIDRDNEKAGPMVWSLPITLFKDIIGRSIDKKSNVPILIDDPEEGYDVVFNRTGAGLKTKYSGVEVLRDGSPIHEDEKLQERWLEYVQDNSLPEILVFYPAEHIEKTLSGRSVKREDDDPTEDRRGGRARSAPAEDKEDTSSVRRGGRRSEPEPEPEGRSRRGRETEDTRKSDETGDEYDARRSKRRAMLDEDPPGDASSDDTDHEAEEAAQSKRGGRASKEPEEDAEDDPVASGKRALQNLKASRGRR